MDGMSLKNRRTYWIQFSCALALFALGNLSLLQYAAGQQLGWLTLLPYSSAVTPLLMILTGVALFGHVDWRRIGMAAAVLVLIGSSMSLVESVFHIDVGLSVMRAPAAPAAPSALTPNPGQQAPNTGLAFFFAAACLLLTRLNRLPRTRLLLAIAVAAVGAGALLGYVLDLAVLFRVASFNVMLAPTALAVTLAGAGLCALNWPKPRKRR